MEDSFVYPDGLMLGHVGLVSRSRMSCDWRLSTSPPITACLPNMSLAVTNITQVAERLQHTFSGKTRSHFKVQGGGSVLLQVNTEREGPPSAD